jgi:hypothetical protein
MTMQADRERDRRSLQDLAKMAQGMTPPPSPVASRPAVGGPRSSDGKDPSWGRPIEARKDDSGIVDLAAAAQSDPQAALRAQSTPLASHGLFDDDAPSRRPLASPPLSSQPFAVQGQVRQPPPSLPPTPGSIAPASALQPALTPSAPPVAPAPIGADPVLPATATTKKSGGKVVALILGGVVALSAAAAGVFFVNAHASKTPEASGPIATIATPPPQRVAAADPAPAPSPDRTPASEPAADPNALPAASPQGKIALAPKIKSGVGKRAAAADEAAPAQPDSPTKLTEKDLVPSPPSGQAGDLGSAMKKEVGDEPARVPAAGATGLGATGNVPQKPSQGAVTGALGAVLPQARACLGPDDPISRASIVFGSNGTVQSVNVSGAAAGKPAEACIKDALTKVKVQPFAEPSYTANITIRHN